MKEIKDIYVFLAACTIIIMSGVTVGLLAARNNTNPDHPCSWYANTYIATAPMRCINYWEHH